MRPRATRSSGAGSRADGPCSASAWACRSCSSTGSSTAWTPRGSTSGPAWSSGCRRPSCPTWAGTPSRRAEGSTAVRRHRGGAVLLRALLRRARVDAAHQQPHQGAAGDLGDARRRPVRRRGRERPALRDPVPPREVRRRRAPRCCATGSSRCEPSVGGEQGAGTPPGRAGARGRAQGGGAGRGAGAAGAPGGPGGRRSPRHDRTGCRGGPAPPGPPGRSRAVGGCRPGWSSRCWSR